MKKNILVFVCSVISVLLFSNETLDLTIDKAIDMALDNNINYLISQEEVRRYKHKLIQNLNFLPKITLEGYKILDEKLMEIEIPPIIPGTGTQKAQLDFTKEYEFSIQIIQPIFTGGKILYSFKNVKLDLNIAKEKKRNAREELILGVKKVFYNILVMRELLKANREALQLAQNNFNNVEERFKMGMVSKYDLLRAELALTSIKPIILDIEKLIKILHLNLKILLRIDENIALNVSGKLYYHEHQLEISKLIKMALLNRSEIKQLKMEIQKVRNLLRLSYAQFIPDFSLIASYSYRSDSFKFLGRNWDDYYTINLGINFPIFNGLKRTSQIGEMKVTKKILQLNYQKLNDATRMQVADLSLTIKKEYENIQLGLKNIETAKEGVRIADLNYQEGLISILELNASYNELTKAKVAYLRAMFNYNIAIAELEKISGIKLMGGQL